MCPSGLNEENRSRAVGKQLVLPKCFFIIHFFVAFILDVTHFVKKRGLMSVFFKDYKLHECKHSLNLIPGTEKMLNT